MSSDLFWLSLTLCVTAFFWIPRLIDQVMALGVIGAFANPSADLAPHAGWAQRAKQAQSNAVESLTVFAPAVLVAHLLYLRGDVVFACKLYFCSRLVHYIAYSADLIRVHTFTGLIGVRMVAATGCWIATMIVLMRIFQQA